MIKKCLFPVAGYGTRFLPATKSMPKEMLPIVNKPLVHYGVEEAINAGMNHMAFVTGRGKRAIADYFDISYELEHQISGTSKEQYLAGIRYVLEQADFSFTRQREMKGLGHAILTGEKLIGHEPFGVVLSDDLCLNGDNGVLRQLVSLYEKHQCSVVAVQEVPADEVEKYGVITPEALGDGEFKVLDMVEKPAADKAPSNLAVIGRYILQPEIFDILRRTPPGKGGEIQLTDALKVLAQQGRVIACQFEGKRFDCGSIEGFVQATDYCYKNEYIK